MPRIGKLVGVGENPISAIRTIEKKLVFSFSWFHKSGGAMNEFFLLRILESVLMKKASLTLVLNKSRRYDGIRKNTAWQPS